MFFKLLSVCSLLFIAWKLWAKKKRSTEPPEMPGRLPLVGHGHRFLGDTTELLKTLTVLAKECREKGGVSYVYMGLWKVYFLTDPEDSLTVSNTCLDKEYIYSFVKPFLGEGLITSDAGIWKRHRKLLNPSFSQIVLNSFIPTFNEQAKVLVDLFSKEEGKPFDHEELLRLNNLETICQTAMGIGGGNFNALKKQYVPLMATFLDIITERFRKVWLHNNFIFNLTALKKKQDEVVGSLLELCDSILLTKKAEMKVNEITQNTTKTKPFLELMLDLTNETGCFTDEEIRNETNTIVLAGHDTSASTLTFAFVLLGTYPEIQEKLYKEVRDVMNDSDTCDKDALSKLVYTEAVIKETLRLYPVGPLVARHIDKPVKLKNYTLEANTGCFIFLGAINRDPVWGADADQFRPERWLDAATLPSADFYAGFGLGRRACIGKVYAMMSMKVMLAHVIRQYKISGDINNMELKWEMMARPKCGHFISIEPRN